METTTIDQGLIRVAHYILGEHMEWGIVDGIVRNHISIWQYLS